MNRPTLFAVVLAHGVAACGARDATPGAEGQPAEAVAGEATRREAGTPAAAAAPAGETPVEITVRVGAAQVSVTGLGACEHAADGSIYERPAALWTVRFDGRETDELRHLSLSFWRERSGTESVTMALQVGPDSYRIATVEGGEKQGSGRAALEGDAAAGTLVVQGTAAEGKPVEVRAKCSRFTTLVAEGG